MRHFLFLLGAAAMAFTVVACGEDAPATEAAVIPDGGVVVQRVQCEVDADCDNGLYCDGIETCVQGTCAAGERVTCDDGIECTRDRCSEALADCEYTPVDADADGHADADCLDAEGIPYGDDCDDGDPNRFPGNVEVCDDAGHDEDCNGETIGFQDLDADMFIDARCCNGERCGTDCNDMAPNIHEGAAEALCDGFDNDCDGLTDEDLTEMLVVDADGDAVGDAFATPVEVCRGTPGFVLDASDCDDADRLVSPNLFELCADDVDNDCDGEVDEEGPLTTWYRDGDGDGFGTEEAPTVVSCEIQDGHSPFPGDCNDRNPLIHPGASEVCNGRDDDCNGQADFAIGPDDGEDDDGDGSADPLCGDPFPDCDDRDPNIYPGAPELCDGLDNDCNGVVDTQVDILEWYVDADADGHGADGEPLLSCEDQPGRVHVAGDCADNDPDTHPASPDDCGGRQQWDDDCDGAVDEDAAGIGYYADTDGDGAGAGDVFLSCVPPNGWVELGGDCAPDDAAIGPLQAEVCTPGQNVDDDCDGDVDCLDADCNAEPACQAMFLLTVVDPPPPVNLFPGAETDITVQLTNLALEPVMGHALGMVAPAGGIVTGGPWMTEADGTAVFHVTAPLTLGEASFYVEAGDALPLRVDVAVIAPPDDLVFSVVNRPGQDAPVIAGPSIASPMRRATHVEVASDGTLYVSDTMQDQIYRVSPQGVIEVIAGTGPSNYSRGSGGAALDAAMQEPGRMQLDEAAGRLYVAEYKVVRAIELSLPTPTIELVAGGGQGGVGGPANTANLGIIADIARTPDGDLLVIASSAIRRVDGATGLLHDVPVPRGSCGSPNDLLRLVSPSGLRLREDGSLWIWGGICGGGYSIGNQSHIGVVLMQPDGSLSHIAGVGYGTPGEGLDRRQWRPSTLYDAIEDDVGNLYLTTGSAILRIDDATGEVRTHVGDGVAASTGEYVSRDAVQTTARGLAIGDDERLYFTEFDSRRVKVLWNGGHADPPQLTIAAVQGQAQTVWPSQQVAPQTAEVLDGNALPVSGVDVWFAWDDPALDVAAVVDTSPDGRASNTSSGPYVPGSYVVSASIRGLAGAPVVSADFDVEVVEPPGGSVTTVLNVAHTYSESGVLPDGAPAASAPGGVVRGVATAPDGTFFAAAGNQYGCCSYRANYVYAVDTGGLTTVLLSGGGYSGDGGPALDATIDVANQLHYDASAERLYVSSKGLQGVGSHNLRMIDMPTGIIDTVAGPVTLGSSIASDASRVYWAHRDTVSQIDVDGGAPTLDPWVALGDCNDAVAIERVDNNNPMQVAIDGQGGYYVAALLCGTDLAQPGWGIVEVDAAANVLRRVAGGGANVAAGGYAATDAQLTLPGGMSFDDAGNLYFVEGGLHWLRRVTPNGTLEHVAGAAAEAGGADFTAGADARFNAPQATAILPDGSVLIADRSNYAIRRYWP